MQELFAWEGILSTRDMAGLVREHVLVKWLQTLKEWLSQITDTDDEEERDQIFTEIEEFFKGWRGFMPANIIAEHGVSEVFKIGALLIIEKAT